MMTNNIKETTTQISVRNLSEADKDRLRGYLRRGDVGKIAIKVRSCGYQQVCNVLSKKHPTDNEEVWQRILEYFAELPKVEMDERFADLIEDGVAA